MPAQEKVLHFSIPQFVRSTPLLSKLAVPAELQWSLSKPMNISAGTELPCFHFQYVIIL
jgi:hypothetical protein